MEPPRLELEVLATDHEPGGEVVMFPNFLQGLEDLVGEFSGGRDDQSAHAVLIRRELW